ncbi:hypothetical protein FGKAn22_05690 [Ferrigenium kumadai]|uniref:DUF2242 domain-containing protein n=1 Tax=Ferrigenium kumadai TaxID=1682490 RepID=A0AAN1SYF5_9PROT|nr:DUF2242 domain-containing protein [Ferrigenium kumadai]BBI98876.1 hypothetical protein FGKAn22_05690 [Ferrigenium kumadai]
MKRYSLFLVAILLSLTACGGPRTYAGKEDFQADPRHRRDFSAMAAPVCDAARRVLQGDGYIVEKSIDQDLIGTKEFPIEDERHAILRLYVTCSQRTGGSTLFVTATEEHFDVKASSESTSIGVPLTPLSISSKREIDTTVKTRGETITNRRFYERFYEAVQRELGR